MQQIAEKPNLDKETRSSIMHDLGLGAILEDRLISQGNINANYIVRTRHGRFILRCYAFRTAQEVTSELHFLEHLQKNGIPVPEPVVDSPIQVGDRPVAVFRYIPGEVASDKENVLRKIARIQARIHSSAKDLSLPHPREGEGLETMRSYVDQIRSALKDARFRDADVFIEKADAALTELRFSGELPSGLVHVDIKPENVIMRGGAAHIIDFDNAYIDAFIVDVGSTLMWWCIEDGFDESRMRLFLEEYQMERELTAAERDHIKDAILFNLVKQALKYAYICLPDKEFAEERGWWFLRIYEELKDADFF